MLRRRGGPDGPDATAPEEVLLDLPESRAATPTSVSAALAVSPNNRWLAYTEDTVGRRMYTLRLRDLLTGAPAAEAIGGVPRRRMGRRQFTVFYLRQDPQTLVRGTVYRHLRGTDPAKDVLVYDEADPELYTGIARSASRRHLMIQLEGYDTTETRVVPLDAPATTPRTVLPRRDGVPCHVRRSSR